MEQLSKLITIEEYYDNMVNINAKSLAARHMQRRREQTQDMFYWHLKVYQMLVKFMGDRAVLVTSFTPPTMNECIEKIQRISDQIERAIQANRDKLTPKEIDKFGKECPWVGYY